MMDTPDELKRDARTEQLRRAGELLDTPDDDRIEPEDITAKASAWHRAMAYADRLSNHGLTVDQRATLYDRADREREELLELIDDYGQQCQMAGFREGLKRRSYDDANKGQA